MPEPLAPPLALSPSLASAWSFLVRCARRYAGTDGHAAPGADTPADLDWTAVLELAEAHGVLPLLCRFLDDSPRPEAPAEIVDRLRTRFRVHAQRSLRLTAELIDIGREMRAAGLDVIAYKGPVLAQQLYGDVSMRDYDDLDFVVRPADAHLAARLLERRGYRPWLDLSLAEESRLAGTQYARHYGNPGTRVGVDLHWGFAQPYLSFTIDQDTLWRNTASAALGGTQVTTLSNALLLLVLCVHGSKHEPVPWCKLKWVVDVAALAHRLPEHRWPSLLDHAGALRLVRPLAFGLLVAHRLLGVPVPDVLAGRRRDRRALEPLVDRVLEWMPVSSLRPAPGLAARWAFDLRLLDRWAHRARYALRRVLVPTPKDWARWKLPDRLRFAYYIVRPVRLGGSLVSSGTAGRDGR